MMALAYESFMHFHALLMSLSFQYLTFIFACIREKDTPIAFFSNAFFLLILSLVALGDCFSRL
jgi:hypothetical protein